eukprot:12201451-Karenia_brevis.AAC.1
MNVDSSEMNTEDGRANSRGDQGKRGEATHRTPIAEPTSSPPRQSRVKTVGPYCLKCTYLGRTPIKESKYMCTYRSGDMPCPMPSVCGEHGT